MSRISGTETASALKRACNGQRISIEDYQVALNSIESYFLLPSTFNILEFNYQTSKASIGFADKYGLKGYDAVQLASAVILKEQIRTFRQGELVYICSDGDLVRAADSEGFETVIPKDE